jgi:hypothetical protein
MRRKPKAGEGARGKEDLKDRVDALSAPASVAGVPGPGRWLVVAYEPTALFSLKISLATSSVGKTLVVPTPYSIKMALVDAAFRVGIADTECSAFLKALVDMQVRMRPPEVSVVTHTFLKIRQESRDGNPMRPYIANIGYREFAFHRGQ